MFKIRNNSQIFTCSRHFCTTQPRFRSPEWPTVTGSIDVEDDDDGDDHDDNSGGGGGGDDEGFIFCKALS